MPAGFCLSLNKNAGKLAWMGKRHPAGDRLIWQDVGFKQFLRGLLVHFPGGVLRWRGRIGSIRSSRSSGPGEVLTDGGISVTAARKTGDFDLPELVYTFSPRERVRLEIVCPFPSNTASNGRDSGSRGP